MVVVMNEEGGEVGKAVRGGMRGRAWAVGGRAEVYTLSHACLSPLLALALPPFGNFSICRLGPGHRFGPSYPVSPASGEPITVIRQLSMDLLVDLCQLSSLYRLMLAHTALISCLPTRLVS
jgi:hypothetical protein